MMTTNILLKLLPRAGAVNDSNGDKLALCAFEKKIDENVIVAQT